MGRIEVTLPDDLENEIRVEIVKRYGGRKGDLGRTVEEALKLWRDNPQVEPLKKVAQNRTGKTRRAAIEALAEKGESAISALIEIGGDINLDDADRQLALEKVKELFEREKRLESIQSAFRTVKPLF